MNTPVNFEIAKLLKEKGFEERAKSYNQDGKLVTVSIVIRRLNPEKIYYPAPTIAEVVMWLYEKRGIWIYLVPAEDNKDVFKPFFRGKNIIDQHLTEFFNSPTEAYEAAILYTLNNLI